jgi:hypothetical protein
MRRTHLIPCLAGLIVAVALVAATGASAASLGLLVAAVACPLSMLVAMRLVIGPAGSSACHRAGASPADSAATRGETRS